MSGPSSAGDLPVTKMYKPRSEKAGQNAFMAGLRAIGGASWNTRYVWTAKGEVLYGAKPGEPEKRIPFVSLTRCEACQMDEMKRHGCPEKYLECGWLLECDEKTTYWACESRDTRDQWVGFLKKNHCGLQSRRSRQGESPHNLRPHTRDANEISR
eukprot:PhF_6_TR17018/c0_g1_i2/m.25815